MSLAENFNRARAYPTGDVPAKKRRPAPFSIRLTDAQRANLVAEAKGAPLGAYIKAKALSGTPMRIRGSGVSISDRSALAKILAVLGKSRLANNLNQIAYAVNIGSLPMTPETEQELSRALRDVRDMRRLLFHALGLKPGEAP